MTKTKIFLWLTLICVGFFAVSTIASYAFGAFIDDTLTTMMLVKWVSVAYVIHLVYGLKLFSQVGLNFKSNWKSLVLYWPVALVILLSISSGWQSTEAALLINIALLAIAAGIGEEVIFRGFFFHYLRQMQPTSIILISSLAFGAVHLAGLVADIPADVIWAQAYFAAGMGVIFGNAKARFSGLTVPIFVHALFDFATIGAAGGVQELFVYDEQIVFGLLFAGTIAWIWGLWLLYIGTRRKSFASLSISA